MNIIKRAFNLKPASIDEANRTVEVVWTSGAAVKRGGYTEVLVVNDESVDLTRLNAGAPVLNTHNSWDLSDVVGVVEEAWIKNGKGYARLRFSERDDAEKVWKDIKDGILRNVSVGYSVDSFREEVIDGVLTITATKWTPVEISVVPVPADADAQIRSAEGFKERINMVNVTSQDKAPEAPNEPSVEPKIEAQQEEVEEQNSNIEDEKPVSDEQNIEAPEAEVHEEVVEETEAEIESASEEEVVEVAPKTTKSKRAPDASVEQPEDDAETRVRSASVQIMRACIDANIAHKAPDFIESGASLDDVRKFIHSSDEIRSLCKRAGAVEKAESFISESKTIDEVRAALLDAMIEADTNINSRFADGLTSDEDKDKQRNIARSLSPNLIYANLNKRS